MFDYKCQFCGVLVHHTYPSKYGKVYLEIRNSALPQAVHLCQKSQSFCNLPHEHDVGSLLECMGRNIPDYKLHDMAGTSIPATEHANKDEVSVGGIRHKTCLCGKLIYYLEHIGKVFDFYGDKEHKCTRLDFHRENKELNKDEVCVYIGRFQPFHKGHYHNVQWACQHYKKVIIFIGRKAGDIFQDKNNPFELDEVRQMIIDSLTNEEIGKVVIEALYDEKSDNLWAMAVQEQVRNLNWHDKPVSIIGCKEDAPYINVFPNFTVVHRAIKDSIWPYHATDIRNQYNKIIKSIKSDVFNITSKDWSYILECVPMGTYLMLIGKYWFELGNKNV